MTDLEVQFMIKENYKVHLEIKYNVYFEIKYKVHLEIKLIN